MLVVMLVALEWRLDGSDDELVVARASKAANLSTPEDMADDCCAPPRFMVDIPDASAFMLFIGLLAPLIVDCCGETSDGGIDEGA